jgi:hypothetical protein
MSDVGTVAVATASGAVTVVAGLVTAWLGARRAHSRADKQVEAAVRSVRAAVSGNVVMTGTGERVASGRRKLDDPDVAAEYARQLVARQRNLDAEMRDGDN